jgi:hypothetical protein
MNERDVFIEALAKNDPTERQVYLDDVCRGDPAMRRDVEALLELHEQAGSFLERPSPGLAATVDNPLREGPGTMIGTPATEVMVQADPSCRTRARTTSRRRSTRPSRRAVP